jgi:hypothetical protein
LVEVCDPSEAAQFGYSVNGVLMSDFYTPRYFDPIASNGVRYSFTDAISEPRQVLPGGYLSWLDPETDDWWQETFFDGTESEFVNLGPLTIENGSFRSQIDRISGRATQAAIAPGRSVAMAAGLREDVLDRSSAARANSLRSQISQIVGSGTPGKSPPPVAAGESARRRHPRHLRGST